MNAFVVNKINSSSSFKKTTQQVFSPKLSQEILGSLKYFCFSNQL